MEAPPDASGGNSGPMPAPKVQPKLKLKLQTKGGAKKPSEPMKKAISVVREEADNISGWRCIGALTLSVLSHERHCSSRGVIPAGSSRCCDDLLPNIEVAFVRKPNNEVDPLTLKVVNKASLIELGIVDSSASSFLSPLLDAGQIKIEGSIVSADPNGVSVIAKILSHAAKLRDFCTTAHSRVHWQSLHSALKSAKSAPPELQEWSDKLDAILSVVNS